MRTDEEIAKESTSRITQHADERYARDLRSVNPVVVEGIILSAITEAKGEQVKMKCWRCADILAIPICRKCAKADLFPDKQEQP